MNSENLDKSLNPSILSSSDVRRIVQILGELGAPSSLNVNERRAQLMNNIAELIGADKWLWLNSRLTSNGLPAFYFRLTNGFSEHQTAEMNRLTVDPEVSKMCYEPIKAEAGRGNYTVVRNDYIPSDVWFAHPVGKQYRVNIGIADYMISIYHLGDGIMSSVGLYHGQPSRTFGTREKTIVHLILSEIDWLHRENTIVPGAYTVSQLSPRERVVLLELLSGKSTKQIANYLKISQHTVNDYLKSLHKRFNVSSRSELLAQFISGTAKKIP